MKSKYTRDVAGRAVLVASFLAVAASSAAAQQEEVAVGVKSTIAVSQTASPWEDSPQYLADRSAGSNYSGVVNLWFRDAQGTVLYGCTGSLLTGGKILTAAHCVTNGSSLLATSFTARFYQSGIGWVDVNGTGMVAKTGYLGNVVSENDVAVLTLNGAPPAFARTYSLANGPVLGQTVTLAGYGLTGDGGTGAAFSNNQFNDNAVLRTGSNKFETTCLTSAANLINAGNCATNASGQAATKGGIFLADFDRNGLSNTTGTLCATLGFCTNSIGNSFAEVLTGPGDSGGANFLSDWTVAGVTSFGQVNGQSIGSFFGFAGGYTCVANITGNAGCQSNYEWVNSQISTVPEPSTVALMATGLLAIAGFARRRKNNA